MLRLRAGCLAPHSSPSQSLLDLSLGVYGAAVASGVAQEKTGVMAASPVHGRSSSAGFCGCAAAR
jgi:hypothetical protein